MIVKGNLIESNALVAGEAAAGGGVYFHRGTVVFNTVRGNVVSAITYRGFGGGIALICDTTYGRTSGLIVDNRISNNQVVSSSDAAVGGGVYVQACDAQIHGNWIGQNTLMGKTAGYGGGAAIWWSRSATSVNGNIFEWNSAGNSGWTNGGGLCLLQSPGILLEGNRFEGNQAPTYDGGGIYCYESSPTIMTNNAFKNNYARYGAGICSEGDLILTNNVLVKNEAEIGGAICVYRVPPGEGLCRIIDNTLSGNVADQSAGGIYAANMVTLIMNTICYGNTAPAGPEVEVQMGRLHAAYSNIRFGVDSIWVHDNGVVDRLAGNINANPAFIDTSYRLSESSPCIGAGVDSLLVGGLWHRAPTSCFHGSPRPNPAGSRPDIGACESPLASPIALGVVRALSESPRGYWLGQNYPNPFNPTTSIDFFLPSQRVNLTDGKTVQPIEQTRVDHRATLTVYDILGREVALLVDEKMDPGIHHVTFDGRALPSGIYIYRLRAGAWTDVKKMTVLR